MQNTVSSAPEGASILQEVIKSNVLEISTFALVLIVGFGLCVLYLIFKKISNEKTTLEYNIKMNILKSQEFKDATDKRIRKEFIIHNLEKEPLIQDIKSRHKSQDERNKKQYELNEKLLSTMNELKKELAIASEKRLSSNQNIFEKQTEIVEGLAFIRNRLEKK